MTYSINCDREQTTLEANSIAAYEAQLEKETDLYSNGMFDGAIGLAPSTPEEQSYWQGYCEGYRKYWINQLGLVLDTEF